MDMFSYVPIGYKYIQITIIIVIEKPSAKSDGKVSWVSQINFVDCVREGTVSVVIKKIVWRAVVGNV